jgi:hypothetical protein
LQLPQSPWHFPPFSFPGQFAIDTSVTTVSTFFVRRLIVNPGTDSAWEIPLPNGVSTLGRIEGNDFVLDHPSVSSHHCEINVMASGVAIKDLGSSNGTFIGEQPVTESLLLPGQMLRLGEVQMQLEGTMPAPVPARTPSAAPAPPPITAPTTAPSATDPKPRCKYHPRNATHFYCPKCHGSFCEMCVNLRLVGGVSKTFCRTCSTECTPVEIHEASPDEAPFTTQVIGAFKYPFKGDGIILICSGTILLLLVDGMRWISHYAVFYGLIAVIILTIFGTGYLTAFLRGVITSTAVGEDEMPDWPEIQDFGSDIFVPFMQLIGTVLFCYLPTIGLTIYAFRDETGDTAWLGPATVATMLFGCVYFPMAFTAVAMTDSVVAVNPLVVIPSIMKVLRPYLLAVAVLAVILLVRWLLQRLLEVILPFPVLPTIITSPIGLYLLVVEMRVLGLLYRNNKDELGWV